MTKQLNKKGTSLVELIAVIVIMGIIAGIAIPTTIAVINRQKKNAAEKSVGSVISTLKNLILEVQADADKTGQVYISATYNGVATPNAFTCLDGTSTSTDTISGYAASDMTVDSFTGSGSVTGQLAADGTITYGGTITVNGYSVAIATDGKCTATKTNSSSGTATTA